MDEAPSGRIRLTAGKARLLLLAGSLIWALAIFLWLQGGLDKAVQLAHEPLRQIPYLVNAALAVSRYGMTACVLIYLFLLSRSLGLRGPKDLQKIFLPIVLSFVVAGAAGDLSKSAFSRQRPYIEHPSELSSVIRLTSSSLPSGHATKSFALILPFVIFAGDGQRKRRALRGFLAATAVAVAYSRVLLGVHYLGDVLAGAGTALLFLPLVVMAANVLYRKERVEGSRMEGLAVACGLILVVMIFYLIRYS